MYILCLSRLPKILLEDFWALCRSCEALLSLANAFDMHFYSTKLILSIRIFCVDDDDVDLVEFYVYIKNQHMIQLKSHRE